LRPGRPLVSLHNRCLSRHGTESHRYMSQAHVTSPCHKPMSQAHVTSPCHKPMSQTEVRTDFRQLSGTDSQSLLSSTGISLVLPVPSYSSISQKQHGQKQLVYLASRVRSLATQVQLTRTLLTRAHLKQQSIRCCWSLWVERISSLTPMQAPGFVSTAPPELPSF